ncbi:hypothetical protein K435DRAFT_871983 [Dendrothele bispora CBS 962.96]|uniref:Uncharacterized protein n=1 Tax=Dendrothele bispora (strain CBS 962.96) TaxID=1314807 RepID=A0A4S8L2T7_DENBC|nr:hypothetical protein K435DRAFT_871983 [Dendrothele bispora CBS 962.96]
MSVSRVPARRNIGRVCPPRPSAFSGVVTGLPDPSQLERYTKFQVLDLLAGKCILWSLRTVSVHQPVTRPSALPGPLKQPTSHIHHRRFLVVFFLHHVPPQHSRYPRHTLSLRLSSHEHGAIINLRATTQSRQHRLNLTYNSSRAVTFTVETLTSHYCPPGSQLILGRNVQAVCNKTSESDLPETLQQSSSQLVRDTQPVAFPTSYSSAIPVTSQSATAFRENPGVAENLLTKENISEHRTAFATSLSPLHSIPYL